MVDENEIVELVENYLADAVLKLDDIGWRQLGLNSDDAEALTLENAKSISDLSRAMVTMNPLIKRGASVRSSYVWGKGIQFEKGEDSGVKKVLDDALLKRYLFSDEAHRELEVALATDGNVFFLADGKHQERYGKGHKAPTGQRIPLHEITGVVVNPDNDEEVWFWRRAWTRNTWDAERDQAVEQALEAWYPTDICPSDQKKRRRIGKTKVDVSKTMFEHSVNKQVGWQIGAPDLTPVLFWAKAHKEFLEDSAKLVKAYARIAFKVTAATPQGVKSAAASVAAQGPRDPLTGDRADVGGTAVMSSGSNIQTIGRTAGSVDFSAGLPLAGYVAAGLEIPLTDLMSDSSLSNRSAAETLTDSKLAAMIQRQNSWVSFFDRLFSFWGIKDVGPYFEKIDTDTTMKAVQSVVMATGTNTLHAEEVRDMLKIILGIRNNNKMPTEKELGNLILAAKQAERQAKKAEGTGTAKQTGADQMNPSYGDNSNREDVSSHEYDPTDGRGE